MTGFVAAWVTGGAIRDGYDPVDEAISRLAAAGTEHRLWMTTGLVAFGVGVAAYSWALRRALDGAAWAAALASALATLGVAAAPLGDHDTAHNIAALTGYAALAATPLLAAPALRAGGRRRWARASIVCGVVTSCLLAVSTLGPWHGAAQRAGLLVTDAWIVGTALTMWRRGRLVTPARS
ncbi:MAG: DUF998 domain-containing protein [Actinomycetota bacterium]|nr:DUF998 domain-containing protein [Actinomycetota bacterium]